MTATGIWSYRTKTLDPATGHKVPISIEVASVPGSHQYISTLKTKGKITSSGEFESFQVFSEWLDDNDLTLPSNMLKELESYPDETEH